MKIHSNNKLNIFDLFKNFFLSFVETCSERSFRADFKNGIVIWAQKEKLEE